MADSYVQYTGDGTTRVYSVPFKFLDRSHVKVTVDGVNRPFDWLSNNSIQMVNAPFAGRLIDIRRSTPNNKPLVDFSDGSTITEEDLDKLAYQNVFLNQEAIDLYTEVSGTANGLVGLVQQALNSATTSEANAADALTRATNAENTVLNTGSQVNTDAAQAHLDAYNAHNDAITASTAANTAVSNSALAVQKAGEAANSAASAAQSAAIAQLAANFNPGDFYTRIEIDGLLNTKTFEMTQINGLAEALDAAATTKLDYTVADISGLQAVLDGKLAVTGTAAAAAKWSALRTITLAGDVTGAVSMDGTANVTLTAAVADNSHLHTIANVTGLQTALDGKAPSTHTHTIANITNLQSALDAKENSLGFTPVQQGGGTGQLTNKVYIGWTAASKLGLQVDASNFANTWPININGDAATLGGSSLATINANIAAKAPLASPALSGVPTAPTAAAGTNTTQLATTAFVTSALAGKANVVHTHAIADISGLQAALDSKLSSIGTMEISNVNGLQTVLDGKADKNSLVTALPILNTAQFSGANYLAVSNQSMGNGRIQFSDFRDYLGLVSNGRTITAGLGLTGGGDLSSDRTITLGTPGTLGPNTTNDVTGTSHTHAINTVNVVGDGVANQSAGNNGVYGLMWANTNVIYNPGDTVAGSKLNWSNANGTNTGGTPNGTWMCMGYSYTGSGTPRVCLWKRIA